MLNNGGRPIRIEEGLPTQFIVDPNGTIYQDGVPLDTLGVEGSEDYTVHQGWLEDSNVDIEVELLEFRLSMGRHRCKE